MQRRTVIQTCLFRLLATALLVISAGFVVLPESNPYSADKTFVKSHTPAADNFASILRADDKEDRNEDQAFDVQLTTDFSAEFTAMVGHLEDCKIKARPIGKMYYDLTYILHRQLLI